MSMIIVDGQSSVGKSTLGEWVHETLGIPVHHWNPGMFENEIVFTREMIRYHKDSDDVAFFDRFFFTGVVYPISTRQKYNREKPWSVQFETWAKGELHKMQDAGKMLLIHARVPWEIWWPNELKVNSKYTEAEQDFRSLYDNFDAIFRDEGWQPLIYNYTDPASIEQTHQVISSFIGGNFSVLRCPNCGATFGV